MILSSEPLVFLGQCVNAMKSYPAILRNGHTLEWLGEVPPESLTGESYDVIITIDTDQFLLPKQRESSASEKDSFNPEELTGRSK